MQATPIFLDWLEATRRCGFSNEQACGLAILFAWRLTQRKSPDELENRDKYWQFVSEEDFVKYKESKFKDSDLLDFIPQLKLASIALSAGIALHNEDLGRRSEGLNYLLDKNIDTSDLNAEPIKDKLLDRHNFDLLWLQKVGECLREEIRNPLSAYVFADFIADVCLELDPDMYITIVNSLVGKLSPFANVLTSDFYLPNISGFEPIQIALLGFSDKEIGEIVWNLQRILFYQQPTGQPKNLDKQYLNLSEFVSFADPILFEFIDANRASLIDASRLIASEYILRSEKNGEFIDQFYELMDLHYGFSKHLEANLTTKVLMNSAATYTLACLCIRNITTNG